MTYFDQSPSDRLHHVEHHAELHPDWALARATVTAETWNACRPVMTALVDRSMSVSEFRRLYDELHRLIDRLDPLEQEAAHLMMDILVSTVRELAVRELARRSMTP